MKRLNLLRVFLIICLIGFTFVSKAQNNEKQADIALHKIQSESYTNLDSTIQLCNKLVEVYSKSESPCKQYIALAQRGICEFVGANQKLAFKTLMTAKKESEQNGCDQEVQFFIQYAFAAFYANIGESFKSDSVARLGISMFNHSWSDKITLIKLYMILGEGEGPLDQVLPYLDTAYRMSKEFGIKLLEQRSLINIGSSYAMNGKYVEASKYLKLALAIAKERKAYSELSNLYNNLAGLADNPKTTLTYIDSALHYAKLRGNLNEIQVFMENKAYFYSTLGDYKNAYTEHVESMAIKDSLFNIQKFEAITEMEEKYEAEKKSNEIKSLKLENLNTEVEKLTFKRNQNRLIIGSSILLLVSAFLAFGFITIRKNRNRLAQKNVELDSERQRSDDLLLNILPAKIADELKSNGKAKAQNHKDVSILFTDFISFTQISEQLTTSELVEEVHICFQAFDQIMDKYGIEKIKTIGDSYMAAGALPSPSKDSTSNTILAALEMQLFIGNRKITREREEKPAFEMRAGIHTGPVVAGIVGVKKFQYDIWGDTVNTASRLESTGSAGKVNISRETYELVKEDARFKFENRGKINAKGKGKIEMYFVELAVKS